MTPQQIGWALAGLALGAGPTWWALGGREAPPAPSAMMEPRATAAMPEGLELPATVPCPDRRQALEGARAALQAELDGLRIAAGIREAQRIEREGLPVPWPDDPGDLGPEALEATFREALDAAGMAFVAMDCDEYPCVLSFTRTDVIPERGTGMVRFEALTAELEARGLGEDRWLGAAGAAVTRGDGAQHYGLVAFGRGARTATPRPGRCSA